MRRCRAVSGCAPGWWWVRSAFPVRCSSGVASSSGACRTPSSSILDSIPPASCSQIFSSTEMPRSQTRSRRSSPTFNHAFDAIPGVQSQGMAKIVPLALMGREEMRMRLDTDPGDQRGPMVLVNRVSPGWFRTVQNSDAGRTRLHRRTTASGARRCRHRERNGRAAVLEWRRCRQTSGRSGSGRRRAGQQVLDDWRDRPASRSTRPICSVQSRKSVSSCERRTRLARRRPCAPRSARMDPAIFVEVRQMTDAVAVALVPAQAGRDR